jgi:GxGYxYP putative glycoside hydrolase C-terminal domain/GxGYxY sequence motif in domain of unknown function N-terminal
MFNFYTFNQLAVQPVRKKKILAATLAIFLFGLLCPVLVNADTANRELWVVPFNERNAPEMVLAQTMQGLSGDPQPRIWLDTGAMNQKILKDLEHEGWILNRVDSVWSLPEQFWKEHPSFITYRSDDQSLNVATSLCGLYNAVAVSENIRDKAVGKGLKEVFSAIGQDPLTILRQYKQKLARGVAVDQELSKASYLRDYAVLNKAFIFSAGKDEKMRVAVAREFTPGTTFFGWGPSEYLWIRDFSHFGSQGLASDWATNLSALSKLNVQIPLMEQRPEPAPVKNGERIVCFILSDGDNLQWLTNNMALDPKFFANPHRGEFEMNWGLSPALAAVAPRVLKYFYENATARDSFFAMGNPGYRYIHAEPVPRGVIDARQSQPLLRASRLRIVTTINTNEGNMSECAPLLELPETDGVVYLSFSPYNLLQGETYWHAGKPVVSSRYILWENQPGGSITEVARSVASMSSSPTKDIKSFAIVLVHAWSFERIGGPIEAVRQTIARFPPGTRVVSVQDYFKLLVSTFGSSSMSKAK